MSLNLKLYRALCTEQKVHLPQLCVDGFFAKSLFKLRGGLADVLLPFEKISLLHLCQQSMRRIQRSSLVLLPVSQISHKQTDMTERWRAHRPLADKSVD